MEPFRLTLDSNHFFSSLRVWCKFEFLFDEKATQRGVWECRFILARVCANLKSVNRFEEGLECLKIKLLEMSSLVENAIQCSIDAVVKSDQGAAQKVLDSEARINTIELEIDALAIELLALHQPMASNLRLIIAVS